VTKLPLPIGNFVSLSRGGPQLEVREDTKVCFCTYCGTKMLLDDGNTTHAERIIDEARIAEAKADETSKKTAVMMMALLILMLAIIIAHM
jgi:hypothetical protein